MVSEAVTNCIRVSVKAFFLPEQSSLEDSQFLYAYRIRITNEGNAPAQLLRRHWFITDGLGRVEEVEGPGVIGQTPWIAPGDSFEYTSSCPLTTQYGVMRGYYEMASDTGQQFQVDISPFRLFVPALAN
jgi:ApaG protein